VALGCTERSCFALRLSKGFCSDHDPDCVSASAAKLLAHPTVAIKYFDVGRIL
jgi:hypothetical protein